MKVKGHEDRENKPVGADTVLGSRILAEIDELQSHVEIVQCSRNWFVICGLCSGAFLA
jgi:predicted CoA-binding protein